MSSDGDYKSRMDNLVAPAKAYRISGPNPFENVLPTLIKNVFPTPAKIVLPMGGGGAVWWGCFSA